jgi:hypothetical protein
MVKKLADLINPIQKVLNNENSFSQNGFFSKNVKPFLDILEWIKLHFNNFLKIFTKRKLSISLKKISMIEVEFK